MVIDQELEGVRHFWDGEAATFDHEPDHGLLDPAVRRAWEALLIKSLPVQPASILDVGCGTGTLSVLLAKRDFDMVGVDLSEQMIAQADAKARAAGLTIPFQIMNAFEPDFPPRQFDVILCRHLLWMSPDLSATLTRWASLLNPQGRLVLVEGYWHTGGGLHAHQIMDALPASFSSVTIEDLSNWAELWGGPVHDERYIFVARG